MYLLVFSGGDYEPHGPTQRFGTADRRMMCAFIERLDDQIDGGLARIYRGMRPRLTSTFEELIVYC